MRHTVIIANNKKLSLNIKELISYKDLFLALAFKDVKVRYSQTYIGIAWAVFQPLITLIIFVAVFGLAINIDTNNVPYPLFAITGLSAWSYFSFVLQHSGSSLMEAQDMIKKIYFPRLIIPLSKSIVALIDFAVTLIFIFILMIWFGYTPSQNIIYLPFFILMTIVSSLSIGIWISALAIRYRDFHHVVPFLVQFGLYATPIAYPSNLFPEKLLFLFYLNPMVGIVEGFRWSLLGTPFPFAYSIVSFLMITLLFISGLYYFRRVEKVMADLV